MNKIVTGSIKNVIFDLGGVILNIDLRKTEQAFISLGVQNFAGMYSQFHASDLFMDLELGKISPDHFIKKLQSLAIDASEADIIKAWNAMLLDIPAGRIRFLQNLRKKYRTFLLSNTNAIHYDAFQSIIGDAGLLDSSFEKAYYSHVLGLRKPDKNIFEWILEKNGLVAEETLFIDDTPDNVMAAQSVKIKGYHLSESMTIEELFAD